MATESFQQTANSFYESNWQSLSIELQIFIRLTIQNLQKPISYHGFGVVPLNLDIFCKVNIFGLGIDESNFFYIAVTSYGFLLLYDVQNHNG